MRSRSCPLPASSVASVWLMMTGAKNRPSLLRAHEANGHGNRHFDRGTVEQRLAPLPLTHCGNGGVGEGGLRLVANFQIPDEAVEPDVTIHHDQPLGSAA